MWSKSLSSLLIGSAVVGFTNGFSVQTSAPNRLDSTSLNASSSSRRAFMESAMATMVIGTAGMAAPAFADDLGDLSMPTADEEKAAAVSIFPHFLFVFLWLL